MAERRMFAKTIIDSDAFLDMPLSAQSLYFHLAMRADDDGFINNPKKIQRMIGASDDDCKLLIAKRFVLTFESGVIVIKHWRIHNYIRTDRYKPTVYQEERASLELKKNGTYTTNDVDDTDLYPVGIPMVDKMDTQVRLGKDRLELGKDRLEHEGDILTAENPPTQPRSTVDYAAIQDLYNRLCPSLPKCTVLSDARKKAIKARFASGRTMIDFETLFRKAEQSNFLKGANAKNWTATFDWLIKDANFAKVLDGNYDDTHRTSRNGNGFQSSNPFLEILQEERGGV